MRMSDEKKYQLNHLRILGFGQRKDGKMYYTVDVDVDVKAPNEPQAQSMDTSIRVCSLDQNLMEAVYEIIRRGFVLQGKINPDAIDYFIGKGNTVNILDREKGRREKRNHFWYWNKLFCALGWHLWGEWEWKHVGVVDGFEQIECIQDCLICGKVELFPREKRQE